MKYPLPVVWARLRSKAPGFEVLRLQEGARHVNPSRTRWRWAVGTEHVRLDSSAALFPIAMELNEVKFEIHSAEAFDGEAVREYGRGRGTNPPPLTWKTISGASDLETDVGCTPGSGTARSMDERSTAFGRRSGSSGPAFASDGRAFPRQPVSGLGSGSISTAVS